MACAEGGAGPDAATPQAQFQGQLSPEGTPPGPIGAVHAAQAAQNQQVRVIILAASLSSAEAAAGRQQDPLGLPLLLCNTIPRYMLLPVWMLARHHHITGGTLLQRDTMLSKRSLYRRKNSCGKHPLRECSHSWDAWLLQQLVAPQKPRCDQAGRVERSVGSMLQQSNAHHIPDPESWLVALQVALQKPKCQAGGDCARTRAALNWPDHLPCVDPSKVSVPVDKSIALLKWFESLGHSVPELRELEAIKRRCPAAAPALPTMLPL